MRGNSRIGRGNSSKGISKNSDGYEKDGEGVFYGQSKKYKIVLHHERVVEKIKLVRYGSKER